MTLTDLFLIRNFLSKVVVRGVEEDQLLALIDRIDGVLEVSVKQSAA